MKTNRTQKHICDFIIEQIEWWGDSNDINSTTHISDLENRLDDIVEDEGWIDKEEADSLETHLIEVLRVIRKLK